LSNVKLAGRSDVTVVWAEALPADNANVVRRTAATEAAKRCEDIMTYLARTPQNRSPALRQEFAQTLEITRPNRRDHATASYTAAGINKRHEGER
jgi:hypothetical protein